MDAFMIVQTQASDPVDVVDCPAPIATGDVIFIRELRLDAHIGAYECERRQPQTLEFELAIGTGRNRACVTDRLGDTIDYVAVVDEIRRLLDLPRFQLLESLAEAVAQMVLVEFGALWVSVSIAKSGIVPDAKLVGTSITRVRQHRGEGLTALAGEASFSVVPKTIHSNT